MRQLICVEAVARHPDFTRAAEALHLVLESGDPFLLRMLAARGFAAAILPRSLVAHSVSVMVMQAGGLRRRLPDDDRSRDLPQTIERTGRGSVG